MSRIMNLTFDSAVSDLCEVNKSFDRGVIRIAYVGENRNQTYISKQAFEKALPSIYNCPIVCNYDVATDTLGGHDIEVIRNSEGGLQVINATDPIGVIPESAKVWFDNYTDHNGVEHEYLYSEALFWKRQAAYQKIKADGITNQSMEIAVNEGAKEDGIYHINDFEFTAFAAIGVTPCFEDASIEVFSQRRYKEQLSEMMEDLRESFSLVNTPSGDDIHPQTFMKGETETLEDKVKLAESYGIDVDSLDFSLEDFTIEELTEKFEAMVNVNSDPENVEPETFAEEAPEGDTPEEEAPAEDKFALAQNVREEIVRALSVNTFDDRWGYPAHYWLQDFDLEAGAIYVEDPRDMLYYGFKFAFDNDSIVIDFDSKKRVKIVFVEFVEGSEPEDKPMVMKAFEELHEKVDSLNGIEAKYQELTEQISALETEANELREFKANVEASVAEEERNAVFAQFEDLAGVEAFEELKSNASQFDVATLEEKCFAIRGRQGTAATFSLESAAPKIKIKPAHNTPKPYGGIVERYLGEFND